MTEKKKYNFKVPQDEFEALLHQYCRNFTTLAAEGRFDPIVGRDVEIDNVMLILLQRNRKNACLLAPAGVGKTALVVGLAQAVVAGRVPDYLKGAQVIELDMPAMAAGTDSPAEFQRDSSRSAAGLPNGITTRNFRATSCSSTKFTRSCRPSRGPPMPDCPKS